MTERFPFERNLLKGLNEKKYIRKMEHIIIDEGKKILNSLRIHYCIVSQENITKFLESHPTFKEDFNKHTIWHQIRIMYLFEEHRVNRDQYAILSTMRQILNKNNDYILRPEEFDNRYYVMKCEWYPKTNKCLRDQCKASEACPHYYKNFETKHDKYSKLCAEYQKKKGSKDKIDDKTKKQIMDAVKKNKELLEKMEKDPKFIEKMEEFQREISYISPKDRLKVFNI